MATKTAPEPSAKKAWTRPVVQKLSTTEALVKIMRAKQPPARAIEQIDQLARSLPTSR
jgi:hypothetical protein